MSNYKGDIMSGYSGWRNYHTWNVALWISNERDLYERAVAFARHCPADKDPSGFYERFIKNIPSEWGDITPDGVSWTDPFLDHAELDEFIKSHSTFMEA